MTEYRYSLAKQLIQEPQNISPMTNWATFDQQVFYEQINMKEQTTDAPGKVLKMIVSSNKYLLQPKLVK